MCYRTGKYTACRRARASVSPDILQAEAVKGLKSSTVPVDGGPGEKRVYVAACNCCGLKGKVFSATSFCNVSSA